MEPGRGEDCANAALCCAGSDQAAGRVAVIILEDGEIEDHAEQVALAVSAEKRMKSITGAERSGMYLQLGPKDAFMRPRFAAAKPNFRAHFRKPVVTPAGHRSSVKVPRAGKPTWGLTSAQRVMGVM